ncbi:leucine--tRNA ligase [Candidatus Giovannonibacteria bacterium RIFCSPHIGHO2_12_44_12]|uniref:Leucine--tRNA ligase n=4 Tax=Candidatus Giovannoniibacteriota TaxID=1752738 RepID=A0A1F5WZQ3_9BACT|nr:MAG: Leucine-tRNA ligase [Candidatus Giovannonibacteria bacterium GW2011_GWC2_44_8]OGF73827.1 MAG: leucine--tRNA ligase [Candidatus Giovannonibacteria bacterium RIFCSPHIGHO2_02_43_16]OGF81132.1 MAG: leucine--tRNA ligase [Candidatus Giovannonibacteria bacterium RIFCSPHIGHO2_12_44_12]
MSAYSKIEKKWQKLWLRSGVYEPDLKKAKKPFYNLMMFPYPSAEGLHIGSVRTFTGIDIYGRFKRMEGYDVFEPIGLDGFGMHSENYALRIGAHPMRLAKVTEKNFYRQLEMIGNGFAWKEKLETYDTEYYKWTQWIFAQMFKKGLAYRKRSPVNWCPSCKTVLADEQVQSEECERCGSKIEKKDLEQWFFRITDYAERLLESLEKIDWPESIKTAQRNWIGRSEGYSLKFPLIGIPGQEDRKHSIDIFTTRPDTLFGVTFVVVSPELAKRWINAGWHASDEVQKYISKALVLRGSKEASVEAEKTGVFSGIYAINPANKEKIPVWVSDYVLDTYGTGAIMAVPAHDSRDFEFAKKFNLTIREVVSPDGRDHDLRVAFTDPGVLINSARFNGANSEAAKIEITKFAGGDRKINYRLRDWLISRQRYWGPPIPMIFCGVCGKSRKGERKDMAGWYPIPEKDLPVKLPFIKDYRPRGTGESPLAKDKKFSKVRCPKCKSWARRETDVSDTFLDSTWYFFRYLDAKNKRIPFDKLKVKKWLPVDMYIGGAEHSVLHLLYSRFVAKAFYDWKIINFNEPFKKFRAHGLIIKDGAKMSKSKGNIVNPDGYFKDFGADVMRLYLAFMAPLEQGGDFRDQGISGIDRFLARVKKLNSKLARTSKEGLSENSEKLLHKSIKKVGDDIENLHYNTAISQLMILLNEFEKLPSLPWHAFEIFLKLLAPFAPHLTEELWQNFKKNKIFKKQNSIHLQSWPKFDSKKIKDESFKLIVQINGRVRAVLDATTGISEKEAIALAMDNENIKKNLSSLAGSPKKTIFVPDKLLNLVI